ncbi:unnamed protein product [Closterium sp. NIES-54]
MIFFPPHSTHPHPTPTLHICGRELLDRFTPEQMNRYEAYRRSGFKQASMRRLVHGVAGTTVSPQLGIVMSGVAKLMVGELVETARLVMGERGDEGPIRPTHIREAYRRLKMEKRVPVRSRPPLFRVNTRSSSRTRCSSREHARHCTRASSTLPRTQQPLHARLQQQLHNPLQPLARTPCSSRSHARTAATASAAPASASAASAAAAARATESAPHHSYPPLPAPHHSYPPLPAPHHSYPPLPAPHHSYPPLPAPHHSYPPLPAPHRSSPLLTTPTCL